MLTKKEKTQENYEAKEMYLLPMTELLEVSWEKDSFMAILATGITEIQKGVLKQKFEAFKQRNALIELDDVEVMKEFFVSLGFEDATTFNLDYLNQNENLLVYDKENKKFCNPEEYSNVNVFMINDGTSEDLIAIDGLSLNHNSDCSVEPLVLIPKNTLSHIGKIGSLNFMKYHETVE